MKCTTSGHVWPIKALVPDSPRLCLCVCLDVYAYVDVCFHLTLATVSYACASPCVASESQALGLAKYLIQQ